MGLIAYAWHVSLHHFSDITSSSTQVSTSKALNEAKQINISELIASISRNYHALAEKMKEAMQ
jgi:hypothetical protein